MVSSGTIKNTGTVTAKAGQNWDKLETIFEQRTAKALGKLGVPTAKDVEVLTQRVEELAAAVARLSKGGAATPAKSGAAKAAPAKKAAATRAGAKKAAPKTAARRTTRSTTAA